MCISSVEPIATGYGNRIWPRCFSKQFRQICEGKVHHKFQTLIDMTRKSEQNIPRLWSAQMCLSTEPHALSRITQQALFCPWAIVVWHSEYILSKEGRKLNKHGTTACSIDWALIPRLIDPCSQKWKQWKEHFPLTQIHIVKITKHTYAQGQNSITYSCQHLTLCLAVEINKRKTAEFCLQSAACGKLFPRHKIPWIQIYREDGYRMGKKGA